MSELKELLAVGLRLCLALEAQAQALNALAASNREIVDAMVGQDDEPDPDAEPSHYMDGSPIKHS